jgi:hypothetical protein
MISLKEFVKQTLTEIDKGIYEARQNGNNAIEIAPIVKKIEVITGDGPNEETVTISPALESVEFDLSVTAERAEGGETAAKGGGGFRIGILSAEAAVGGASIAKATNTTVQRIKFSIPFKINKSRAFAEIETRRNKRAQQIHCV